MSGRRQQEEWLSIDHPKNECLLKCREANQTSMVWDCRLGTLWSSPVTVTVRAIEASWADFEHLSVEPLLKAMEKERAEMANYFQDGESLDHLKETIAILALPLALEQREHERQQRQEKHRIEEAKRALEEEEDGERKIMVGENQEEEKEDEPIQKETTNDAAEEELSEAMRVWLHLSGMAEGDFFQTLLEWRARATNNRLFLAWMVSAIAFVRNNYQDDQQLAVLVYTIVNQGLCDFRRGVFHVFFSEKKQVEPCAATRAK